MLFYLRSNWLLFFTIAMNSGAVLTSMLENREAREFDSNRSLFCKLKIFGCFTLLS